MGIPSQYFVDPGWGGPVFNGTAANPWASVQAAVTGIIAAGRDAINGDAIALLDEAPDVTVAALNLAGYVPAADAPLIIRGCGRNPTIGLPDENYPGIGDMDGNNGGWSIYDGNAGATDYVHFIDMHLHNTAGATIASLRNWSTLIKCELDTATVRAVFNGIYALVANCYVHDVGGNAIEIAQDGRALGNYIESAAASCIFMQGPHCTVERNILVISGLGTAGVIASEAEPVIRGNSILSTVASADAGIRFDNVAHHSAIVADNLIEGFSGAGGAPIDWFNLTQHVNLYANNSFFGNTNPLPINAGDINYEADNEALDASLFLREGAMTFANRFNYFKPSIPVRGRSFPNGCRFDRGGVQVRLVVERTVPERTIVTVPARTAFDPIE